MSINVIEVPEQEITLAILEDTFEILREFAKGTDVIIAGAGPSGLVCAYYCAKAGLKTLVIEKLLHPGGGIPPGGMGFPRGIVASPADEILKEVGCELRKIREGVYIFKTADMFASLLKAATGAGVEFLFGIYVEDLIYREKPLRVTGAVINWTANLLSGLHMDPLMIPSKAVVDATGHDAELLKIGQERIPNFPFKVKGHKGMYAYEGEKLVTEKSGEVIPGLYVTGMATASLYGLPRMGPIFSSMLLSGKKVADEIIRKLK